MHFFRPVTKCPRRRLGVQFCHDAGHFGPGRNRTHTDQICLGCRLPKTGRARVLGISELHSRPPSFSIRILLCSAQPLQGFPLGRHLRRWWLVPKACADASFFLWFSQNGSGLLKWLWLLLLRFFLFRTHVSSCVVVGRFFLFFAKISSTNHST